MGARDGVSVRGTLSVRGARGARGVSVRGTLTSFPIVSHYETHTCSMSCTSRTSVLYPHSTSVLVDVVIASDNSEL